MNYISFRFPFSIIVIDPHGKEKQKMAYKNGTVYGKYIKIKSGDSGVKNAVNYIDDNDKISTPNKPQNPADLQPENVISDDTLESADEAISYIGNETKTLSPDDFQRLISGINCDSNHAAKDFSETEKRYYSNKTEEKCKHIKKDKD